MAPTSVYSAVEAVVWVNRTELRFGVGAAAGSGTGSGTGLGFDFRPMLYFCGVNVVVMGMVCWVEWLGVFVFLDLRG